MLKVGQEIFGYENKTKRLYPIYVYFFRCESICTAKWAYMSDAYTLISLMPQFQWSTIETKWEISIGNFYQKDTTYICFEYSFKLFTFLFQNYS